MLIHEKDLLYMVLQDIPHSGAFGTDYVEATGPADWLAQYAEQGPWYAVWKFPWDLQEVEGFLPFQFPVPVGDYPLLPDSFVASPCAAADPVVGSTFTKWRVDEYPASVSYLKNTEDGTTLAMLPTKAFLRKENFGDLSKRDRATLKQLVADLARAGVCAVSCHGQHHAVVLISAAAEPLTPQRFASIIPQVQEAILKHSTTKPQMGRLLAMYQRRFGSSVGPATWDHMVEHVMRPPPPSVVPQAPEPLSQDFLDGIPDDFFVMPPPVGAGAAARASPRT